MDRLIIDNVEAACVLGVHEPERRSRQAVIVTVELGTNLRMAARSDDLRDTVDYAALYSDLVSHIEQSSFRLLETLAESIAALCLENRRVAEVRVRLSKPGALPKAACPMVDIVRP